MFFPVVSHSSVLPYAVPPVLHRSSPSLWSQGVSGEAQEVEVEGLEEGAAEDQQQLHWRIGQVPPWGCQGRGHPFRWIGQSSTNVVSV